MSVRTIVLLCVLPLCYSGLALGEHVPEQQPTAEPSQTYEAIRPCIGTGYQPYSYPAVGTCSCAENHCFHPQRYYCGGKSYKKSWLKKWVGTQLGKRSMLDDYCCDCLLSTAVPRTYLKTIAVPKSASEILPAPASEGSSESKN